MHRRQLSLPHVVIDVCVPIVERRYKTRRVVVFSAVSSFLDLFDRRFMSLFNRQLVTFAQHQMRGIIKDTTQFMYAKQAASIVSVMYPPLSPLFFKREEAFMRVHARLLREQRAATLNSIAQELLSKTSDIPRDTLMDLVRAIERDGSREFE